MAFKFQGCPGQTTERLSGYEEYSSHRVINALMVSETLINLIDQDQVNKF